MFIKKDGTMFLFCSSKCQANLLKLGRIPRWTPWTQAARRAAGIAAEPEAAVVEEAAEAIGEVKIETAKGKDIPSDLVDLIDKRLGPDLSRGDVEKHYHDFVESETFRHSIAGWAKKAHAGKAVTHIEKAEFFAYKDSAEGRRVFKAWLDGQWAKVKGRKAEGGEGVPAPIPAKAKKAKKGA